MQHQEQSQVKALIEQLNALKVRIFDAQEQLSQTNQFQNEFFGHLSQMLGIDQEQAKDPNAYLSVIGELVKFHNEHYVAPAKSEEVEYTEVE